LTGIYEMEIIRYKIRKDLNNVLNISFIHDYHNDAKEKFKNKLKI